MTSASGILGTIGSVPALCHSICMSIVSFLALAGITLNILPLMFLTTYQAYFWLAALLFTTASLIFYLRQDTKSVRERGLLLFNGGILLFSLPVQALSSGALSVFQLSDYQDFFRFIGLLFVLLGLMIFLFGKRIRLYTLPDTKEKVIEKKRVLQEQHYTFASAVKPSSHRRFFSLSPQSVLFGIVLGGFFLNQLLMYRLGVFAMVGMPEMLKITAPSKMKMAAFDIALAKERMDKNNDGICDACGMPVQQCIDTGQIDCTMVGNSDGIGVLGSNHTHADLAVFVSGEKVLLGKAENFMKSSFLHLDANANPDDANAVLHQHAGNVPLWLFFRSIGMNLAKDSMTLSDGTVVKNEDDKTLKFYVDGKKVPDVSTYTFQPDDKILISYGPPDDPLLQKQIASVTDFAKGH